jgi:hypothetical protein
MKMKSFMFGLGFGLMIVSVIFYFIYGYQVRANNWESDSAKKATDAEIMQRAEQLGMVSAIEAEPTEDKIIELATGLGMVPAQEAEPGEERIIELATELGMVFAEKEEAAGAGLTAVTDESESGAALSVVAGGNTDEGETENGGSAEGSSDEAGQNDGDISGEGSGNLAGSETITDESGRVAVDIPEGLNAYEIAVLLRGKGIIQDEEEFINYLNDRGLTRILQYGRYYFFENEDLESIAESFRTAALNA